MSRRFIVIDTNIFISAALSPKGKAYQAVKKAINNFIIVQSQATYQELTERIYQDSIVSLREFLELDFRLDT
jgi:predicted nucleic acid-binding protein